MRDEKAAGAFGPHGSVENQKAVARSFYQAPVPSATDDMTIWPFEHISIGLALAADRITRRWRVSRPLARAIAEANGWGGCR